MNSSLQTIILQALFELKGSKYIFVWPNHFQVTNSLMIALIPSSPLTNVNRS